MHCRAVYPVNSILLYLRVLFKFLKSLDYPDFPVSLYCGRPRDASAHSSHCGLLCINCVLWLRQHGCLPWPAAGSWSDNDSANSLKTRALCRLVLASSWLACPAGGRSALCTAIRPKSTGSCTAESPTCAASRAMPLAATSAPLRQRPEAQNSARETRIQCKIFKFYLFIYLLMYNIWLAWCKDLNPKLPQTEPSRLNCNTMITTFGIVYRLKLYQNIARTLVLPRKWAPKKAAPFFALFTKYSIFKMAFVVKIVNFNSFL